MIVFKDKLYFFLKIYNISLSILRSRDRIAYYVIFIKVLGVLMYPINWMLYLLEMVFRKQVNGGKDVPVVFVVGTQGSGSTLISQVIADAFPFFPVGNICGVFSRSAYYIHFLLRCFRFQREKSFLSYYGISKGIFTIGDCYEVWDRWLGKNHYTVPDTLSQNKKAELKNYFGSLAEIYKRPIISKNNRNTLCLLMLQEVFPKSFFVVTQREAAQVILYTLEGSKNFFGDTGYLWGLKPFSDFNEKAFENRLEAACFQYAYLDKQIKEQLKHIGQDNYQIIQYEAFCKDPDGTLMSLYQKLKNKMDFPDTTLHFNYEKFSVQPPTITNQNLIDEVNFCHNKAVKCIAETNK